MAVFDQSKDFCVLTQLVPKIYYHPDSEVLYDYDFKNTRKKRESFSLTLAMAMGKGLAADVKQGLLP
jgi:neutral trehalase